MDKDDLIILGFEEDAFLLVLLFFSVRAMIQSTYASFSLCEDIRIRHFVYKTVILRLTLFFEVLMQRSQMFYSLFLIDPNRNKISEPKSIKSQYPTN